MHQCTLIISTLTVFLNDKGIGVSGCKWIGATWTRDFYIHLMAAYDSSVKFDITISIYHKICGCRALCSIQTIITRLVQCKLNRTAAVCGQVRISEDLVVRLRGVHVDYIGRASDGCHAYQTLTRWSRNL